MKGSRHCARFTRFHCAEKLGLDIGQLTIDARYDFDRRGVMLMEEVDKPFTRIELDITASGTASEAELQQLSEEVAKYCPLAKLFRQAGTKIEENWHK
ncbi:OsmC family protein [Granulosicoccus sp.]|nr:OsmC family protein [Granulosicoccus sp.]